MMFGKVGLALSGGGLPCLAVPHRRARPAGGARPAAPRRSAVLRVRRLDRRRALLPARSASCCRARRTREITRDDYVDIVQAHRARVPRRRPANLRTRLFAEPAGRTCASMFGPSYTPHRPHLGELFERHLYARVGDGGDRPRWLNELMHRAAGRRDGFHPKLDNWRACRQGADAAAQRHHAQYRAQLAVHGHLDGRAAAGADTGRRQRPPAPHVLQGGAAGAPARAGSVMPLRPRRACRALFDPRRAAAACIRVSTVRLVDGGVHDNQGVAGLLEQECSVVLVSDASGQTNMQAEPSGELRCRARPTILMARRGGVRDQADRLRPRTSYGTERRVQEALAGLRTDWIRSRTRRRTR